MQTVLWWIRWSFAGTSLVIAITAQGVASLFKLIAEVCWPPEEPPA